MYRFVALNQHRSVKDRIINLIAYYRIKRGTNIAWSKRYKKVFELHPEYKIPIDKEMELEHQHYWGSLAGRISLSTLRVCSNISGVSDIKYIPEEVFKADIELTLNPTPSIELLTYKSLYSFLYPRFNFPECYFHNIEGGWYDSTLKYVDYQAIERMMENLNYPVVIKPNRNSYGGRGLNFPKNSKELQERMNEKIDFVVQKRIIQHSFFAKFNSIGLNTIRVCLYRSVIDNKIHVLNCALRMGVGGSLDNETAGGIVCFIDENGQLGGTARDKYGKNYQFHPDTNLPFKEEIPFYTDLIQASINLSEKIFYARLISLDYCLDIYEKWRPIEINLFGHTIRFSQYAGQPFFGRFTEEVLKYCTENHWIQKKLPE